MLKTPIVDVVGYKNAGKTSIVERIVSGVSAQGYRTCVFKHVHDPDFSIDVFGKDSWRAAEAGAERVVLVSEREKVTIERAKFEKEKLSHLLTLGEEFDLILLEGFKSLRPTGVDIYYVLATRNEDDIQNLSRDRENILFVNSPVPVKTDIVGQVQVGNLLADEETAREFVDETIIPLIRTGRIWKTLPDLDCGECGYESCREMAEAIARKKDLGAKCTVESDTSRLVIQIGETRLAMKRFVQDLIRGSILAMVSTLKGATISGDENVTVIIKEE